jgi:uncharacterized protein involved in exopolysaccharide biosynthesis
MDRGMVIADIRGRIGISVSTSGPQTARSAATTAIVTVAFTAPDPKRAATGSAALATLLMDKDRAIRIDADSQRRDALQRDVDRLEQALEQTSATIIAFQRDHRNALPDSLDFRRNQHLLLQDRLTRLEDELTTLRDKRDRMLRMNLAARRANGSVQTYAAGPALPAFSVTPPSTAFDIELARADVQMDAFGQRAADVRAQLRELDQSVRQTPENALTLTRLERQHAALQDQYAQALAATALVGPDSGNMAATTDRIRLIERANVPQAPVRPDPAVVMGASLAGGAVFGLALLAALALMRRSIDRPADLTAALGITPFAALPYLPSHAQVWRGRAVVAFAVLAVGLGVVLVAGGVPLDRVMAQVMAQSQ